MKEIESRLKNMQEEKVYTIDRFEGDLAVCEDRETKEMINIKNEALKRNAKVIINDNTIPLKEEYSNSFGYFILNNNIILIPRIYKTDFWYKIYLNRKKYNCNTLVSSKCFFILIYINLL